MGLAIITYKPNIWHKHYVQINLTHTKCDLNSLLVCAYNSDCSGNGTMQYLHGFGFFECLLKTSQREPDSLGMSLKNPLPSQPCTHTFSLSLSHTHRHKINAYQAVKTCWDMAVLNGPVGGGFRWGLPNSLLGRERDVRPALPRGMVSLENKVTGAHPLLLCYSYPGCSRKGEFSVRLFS